MEEKIQLIKEWLGTGSINIFGLPMSGKDTQGIRLAEALGAKFLSSGLIIRAMEEKEKVNLTDKGQLAPTDLFYKWVLPYFEREDLMESPLILSSIGRCSGEEEQVMSVAEGAGHPIKAAVVLNASEEDVMRRWEAAKILNDRGVRADDNGQEVFKTRIKEFKEKTMPVLRSYNELGILVKVRADFDREAVFENLVSELAEFCKKDD